MLFVATWMDLDISILSEDRERQISQGMTYMWNFKIWYRWIFLQNRNKLTDIEGKFVATKEDSRGWGRRRYYYI